MTESIRAKQAKADSSKYMSTVVRRVLRATVQQSGRATVIYHAAPREGGFHFSARKSILAGGKHDERLPASRCSLDGIFVCQKKGLIGVASSHSRMKRTEGLVESQNNQQWKLL